MRVAATETLPSYPESHDDWTWRRKSSSSQTRTALDKPAGPRVSSIRITNEASEICSRLATAFNASQKAASRLIDVRWPAIENERLTGRAEAAFAAAAALAVGSAVIGFEPGLIKPALLQFFFGGRCLFLRLGAPELSAVFCCLGRLFAPRLAFARGAQIDDVSGHGFHPLPRVGTMTRDGPGQQAGTLSS